MDIDKVISEAHMKAGEWNLDNYREGSSVFDQICFYVFNLDKLHLELFSVSEEQFYEFMNKFSGVPYPLEDHGVLQKLDKYWSTKSKLVSNDLAAHMTSYLSTTLTWKQTKPLVSLHSSKKPHSFLVIYKGKRKVNKQMIRPFVILDERRILPVSECLGYFKKVIQMDAQKHPEWLK